MLFTLGIFLTGTTSTFADDIFGGNIPIFHGTINPLNEFPDGDFMFNTLLAAETPDILTIDYDVIVSKGLFTEGKTFLREGFTFTFSVLEVPDGFNVKKIECLENNEILSSLTFTAGRTDHYECVISVEYIQPPIAVGTFPMNIAVNEKTNYIYTANNGDGSISVINGDRSHRVITYINDPQTDPFGYTVNELVNGAVTNISIDGNPSGITVNEETNTIYVTSGRGDGKVSVINGNTVTDTISTGSTPSGIAVNESTNTIYVANFIPSQVQVINGDTNTEITKISTGQWTADVAVNESTNTIYTANFRSGTVSVIDGDKNSNNYNTVIKTITVEGNPSSIAVNEVTNTIYVATGPHVSVIDGNDNSVTDTISVLVGSGSSGAITVNESTNTIYVVNSGTDIVSVIDGDKHYSNCNLVIETINVGNNSIAIVVNEQTNKMYVAHNVDSTVTIAKTTQ